MYASAKAAESTFDRSVTGKNNAALDADNEPIRNATQSRPLVTTVRDPESPRYPIRRAVTPETLIWQLLHARVLNKRSRK
jgi:hypothetical protein